MQDDAVVAAVHDQLAAGLDVITDGEQTRLDFNLSFYGYLEGIELEGAPPRRFGPPAHDQRGRHAITGELARRAGSGVVEEFERLQRLAPRRAGAQGERARAVHAERPAGARTRSYPDRWALTEALLPIVRRELEALVAAGCREITVDEPSMSCYAHREDPRRFVDIFNRTVEPVVGPLPAVDAPLLRQLQGPRRRAAPLRADVPGVPRCRRRDPCRDGQPRVRRDRDHRRDRRAKDVAVGIIDVKSYYIETPELIAERVRLCLQARARRAARRSRPTAA